MRVTLNRQRPRKRPLPCPVQPTLPAVERAAGLKHLPQPAPSVLPMLLRGQSRAAASSCPVHPPGEQANRDDMLLVRNGNPQAALGGTPRRRGTAHPGGEIPASPHMRFFLACAAARRGACLPPWQQACYHGDTLTQKHASM